MENNSQSGLAARIAQAFIVSYQKVMSPLLGKNCRYQPTCSSYAHTAVGRFGLLQGAVLAAKRLGRCHPWNEGGYDPVPGALDRPLDRVAR